MQSANSGKSIYVNSEWGDEMGAEKKLNPTRVPSLWGMMAVKG